MIIDFHTHKKREKTEDIIEVVSVHPQKNTPTDWHTIGYHPWWSERLLTDFELDFLKRQLLEKKFCLAVGECGLDKLKGVDLNLQEQIFLQQIELANALGAPVIVHCVRAYDKVMQLFRKRAKTPWAVHGYRRNATLAKQLTDAGLYLSVAPDAAISAVFLETLRSLPLEKCFLETDSDPSMNISERYTLFATIKNIDICTLENQLMNNFKTFFRWKYHG